MIHYILLTVAAILLSATAWHTYYHESISVRKVGGIHFIKLPAGYSVTVSKKKGV